MAVVVEAANAATAAADTVGRTAHDINGQADILRQRVRTFLDAVRDEVVERRRFERLATNGVTAIAFVSGRQPETVVLKDISAGGASFLCTWTLVPGLALELGLPGMDGKEAGRANGRVVRTGGGVLAMAFSEDAATRALVARSLEALTSAPIAA